MWWKRPRNSKIYVYTCFDPLVRPRVSRIFERRFGRHNVFIDSDPGAVKNLVAPQQPSDTDFVLWKMQAAYKLHPFDIIILVNHSNCGAYKLAGESFTDSGVEEEFHRRQLQTAQRILNKRFPNVKVDVHYFLKDKQKFLF